MKAPSLLAGLVSAAALVPAVNASVVIRNPTAEEAAAEVLAASLIALKRATPDAPNGYAPSNVDCPENRPVIRDGSSLSPNETQWLQVRRNNTVPAMKDLLRRMNITGLDTDSYIDSAANNVSALPNIAIAGSGGGYRALMNYAGAVSAFDNRTANSTGSGQLGGLLQASTYLAGLSGGSWMVGSLFVNNFTSVSDILALDTEDNGGLWQFGNSILEGPKSSHLQILSSVEYYKDLYDQVQDKNDAGYSTTITDYWGRALAYQLVNATDGGLAYTFSSVSYDANFVAGNTPMPILVTDGRTPGELVVDGNATVYEINPWELGTFDPTTWGFAPLRYVGSNFTNGSVPSDGHCVRGFDNAGFIMGTSSSLFNEAFLTINGTDGGILDTVITKVLAEIGQDNNDIADYPNPFYDYHTETSTIYNRSQLTLVDGGEDGQNIPLHPLIQPIREVDVIFAIDSSADTTADGYANWPNGTSLIATYQRSFLPISNGTSFPAVPDYQSFVNLGLNNRPTFFGCDVSNTTSVTPLIVYIPNAPYVYKSNVSTYDLAYNDTERNYIIENGYNVATMGNGTLDANWPTCVGCAILSRSLNRTNTAVPDVCTQCFNTYCWDGTTNTTENVYKPTMKLSNDLLIFTNAAHSAGPSLALAMAVVATVFLVL